MIIIYILAALLFVLNVLDIITTHNTIRSKRGVEGNPIVAFFMRVFGAAWWVPKSALIIGATIMIVYKAELNQSAAILTLTLLCAIYSWAVYNNYKIWRNDR